MFRVAQVRAFVRRPGNGAKQELNQSPLAFVETPYQCGGQQALARNGSQGDGKPPKYLAVIAINTVLFSALNFLLCLKLRLLGQGKPVALLMGGSKGDKTPPKYLAVLAINTVRFLTHLQFRLPRSSRRTYVVC